MSIWEQLYNAIAAHTAERGYAPDRVYMGEEQYDLVRMEAADGGHVRMREDVMEIEVMGLRVYRVKERSHLLVT